ncbi:MAG: hypothetical protein MAG453_00851 [Calditrichaeota bacterium]|nr:hypothetical protein [Calditrichota bacterium]
MRWVFFALLVVHGLIHLIGPAQAFALAEFPQLTRRISKPLAVLFLAAGLALFATAVLVVIESRGWWAVGLAALVLSQLAIVAAWTDAKPGTIANLFVLAGVVYGYASIGPAGFSAQYRRAVEQRLAQPVSPPPVREADLAHLPPVRKYLRETGSLGGRRVHHFRARWDGRIRSGADEPWMEFTAEQVNVPAEPSRFFLMDATRSPGSPNPGSLT